VPPNTQHVICYDGIVCITSEEIKGNVLKEYRLVEYQGMDMSYCNKDRASSRKRGLFRKDIFRTINGHIELSAFSAVPAGPSILFTSVTSPLRTLEVWIIVFSSILN
jgi:hypothetical protein